MADNEDKTAPEYLRARSVMLFNDEGLCSGEQVKAPSGVNYILSAGHCMHLANSEGFVKVKTEDGQIILRRVIGEDPNSDLMLVEGLPDLDGIEIGIDLRRAQHIRTFTHGKGMDTYETDGLVVGKTIARFVIKLLDTMEQKCPDMAKIKTKMVDGIFGPVPACVMESEETITTAMIVPGSSGGMAVDDDGRLIGVASATDGSFGYLVKLEDIRAFLANR